MALTAFQLSVLRLLADNRRNNAESYVAGGLALNYKLGTPRVSRGIGVFHDSEAALLRSWQSDSATLAANGFAVKLLRKYASFVEADVSKGNDHLEVCKRFAAALENDDPIIAANAILVTIDRACALLHRQIEKIGEDFREQGGFTEHLTKVRLEARDAAIAASDAPKCPKCGGPMRKVVAKKGSNAGNPFWSCQAYPNCTGTRKWEWK